MKWILFVAVVFCIYWADAAYNANRLGSTCGGTRNKNGTCTDCPDGFEGYDCSIPTDSINGTDCAEDTCVNGGTCWNSGSGATCTCAPRYTGANCSIEIFDLTCDNDANTRTLVVTPAEEGFPGYLSVLNFEGTAACADLDGTSPTELNDIPDDGTCDDAELNGPAKVKKYLFQQIENVVRSSDFVVITKCGVDNIVNASIEVVEVTSDIESDLEEIEVGSVPIITDIRMRLFDDTDEIIGTDAVLLGDEVKVVTELTEEGKENNFKAIRLENCTINNGKIPQEKVDMITNSCPDEELIFKDMPTIDGTEITWSFYAFKFLDEDNVFVNCLIKVCLQEGDCIPEGCSVGVGLGRKKRDVDAAESETHYVQAQFSVRDPLQEAVRTIQEFKESKACYQTWEMTATVVALSVALFIVLLICIFLIVKNILDRRSRSRSTYREDVSESASTAHFPQLPTIVPNKP